MPFFFLIKTEQEGNTDPVWGIGTSGRGETIRKGSQRVNRVEGFCTHVCKLKNETCENYSRNEGRGSKENVGG
jgi:hypothetical protein